MSRRSSKSSTIRGLDNIRDIGMFLLEDKRQKNADAERAALRAEQRATQEEDQGFQREQMSAWREDRAGKAKEAQAEAQAAFSETAQRGRVMKNLEAGNIPRAKRIAWNRGLDLPEHMADSFEPKESAEAEHLRELGEREDFLELGAKYRKPEKSSLEKLDEDLGRARTLTDLRHGGSPVSPESREEEAVESLLRWKPEDDEAPKSDEDFDGEDLADRNTETMALFSSIFDSAGVGKPGERTFTPDAQAWLEVYAKASSGDRARMLAVLKDKKGWNKKQLEGMLE